MSCSQLCFHLVVIGLLDMAYPNASIRYIPAKAKALPHDGASALVYPVVNFILHIAAA